MIIKKNYGGVNCMICIRTKFRCSPFHLVSVCKVGYIPFAKIWLAWTFLTEKGKTDYKINAFFLSWKLKLELACVFFPKTQNRQQRKFARKPRLRERETGKESTYLVTKSCTLIRLWTKKHSSHLLARFSHLLARPYHLLTGHNSNALERTRVSWLILTKYDDSMPICLFFKINNH